MAVSKVNYGSDTLMDLTEDTVTPTNLMKGATAHNSAGESITGVLEATEITTTLSADSTDEKVPSAKCVYDAIQAIFGGKTVVFSDTPPTVDDQNVITFVKRSG